MFVLCEMSVQFSESWISEPAILDIMVGKSRNNMEGFIDGDYNHLHQKDK